MLVMLGVFRDNMAQVPLAEDDHAIEALGFDRADEAFGVGVEVGTPWWQPNGLDTARSEHRIERCREEWITIVDQVAVLEQEAIEAVHERPSDSDHPVAIWILGDPCDGHSAGGQVDDEEHMEPGQPTECPGFNSEKVGGRDRLPMGPEKHTPRRVSLGRRLETVFSQYVGDRGASDAMAQLLECALKPEIALVRVLFGHAHHQLPDLLHDARSPRASLHAPIVLLGNQPAMPSQNRVRRDDGADLAEELPAEQLALRGQPPALGVAQTHPSTPKLLSQDSILLAEILDYLLLPVVEHARDNHAEQLPRLRGLRHARSLPRRSRPSFWIGRARGIVFQPLRRLRVAFAGVKM